MLILQLLYTRGQVLSFGRDRKSASGGASVAGTTAKPSRPATVASGAAASGMQTNGAAAAAARSGGEPQSPKARAADGEMDDEELERYLRDLELHHETERANFEAEAN